MIENCAFVKFPMLLWLPYCRLEGSYLNPEIQMNDNTLFKKIWIASYNIIFYFWI